MENRNGLVINARLTQATGTAERDAALAMLWWISGTHRVTVGADKGYDAWAFVEAVREINITPHVAQTSAGARARSTSHGAPQRIRAEPAQS
jgi:hypothetical protein